MKRSALQRKKPMRRARHLPWGPTAQGESNKYARRPRAPEWLAWVRTQRCMMEWIGSAGLRAAIPLVSLPCSGRIEANHVGERIAGFGTIAPDHTAVPHCNSHHRQWTEYSGMFAGFSKAERRQWAEKAIAMTHELARRVGVEVPSC